MGMTSDQAEHIESIVYFLTEALRAAVESGDSVQQSLCDAPQFTPNMSCGEIAERLAAYRRHLRAVWSYEVLLVAKILRARELAKELRALEPELRPELDTFRLATVSCADLQELLMPNAQNLFNGADHACRIHDDRAHIQFEGGKHDPLSGYRVAGHTDIRLLLSACETLHFGLAARYALDPLLPSAEGAAGIGDAPGLGHPDEEAFLLTDFCEVLPEAVPAATEWQRGAAVGDPARLN